MIYGLSHIVANFSSYSVNKGQLLLYPPKPRQKEKVKNKVKKKSIPKDALFIQRQGLSCLRDKANYQPVTSLTVSPILDGSRVYAMPASSNALNFSSAVPLPPEIIAPAWPIRLPLGAVTPAM